MKAVIYKFCEKTILQVGPICNVIASHATILQEIEVDVIHIEEKEKEKEKEKKLSI